MSENEAKQQFVIQKLYLKDFSFESPGAPESFQFQQWDPKVELNMSNKQHRVADNMYEVVLTVTVTVSQDDNTMFLIEVHQAGLFAIAGFTDQVIAEKDREITELRRRLEEQSVAVPGGAATEILDSSELIREERGKLARLQDEWREKLRQAEIDASVERAKLARERVDLDEKMQLYEAHCQRVSGLDDSGPGKRSGKAQGGRWLSRLGLKEDE